MMRTYLKPILAFVVLLTLVFSARPQTSHAQGGLPHFLHIASARNTTGHITLLNDQRINDDPNAVLLVTQNWNPNGQGGVYNPHTVGVYYTGKQWAIFNEDHQPMPPGAAFNVAILDSSNPDSLVTASDKTVPQGSDYTVLYNKVASQNPQAMVFVTPAWISPAGGSVYNPHPIGVWYTQGNWAIFNEDQTAMPLGKVFNVGVLGTDQAYIQQSNGSNISGDFTTLDYAPANDNPNAMLLVTQNWNPGGQGGAYNAHEIGVFYTGSRWAIFNQDLSPMNAGLSFNVAYIGNTNDNPLPQAVPANGGSGSVVVVPAVPIDPTCSQRLSFSTATVVPSDGLNLRLTPNGRIIVNMPAGAQVQIINGPSCTADGVDWWQLTYTDDSGNNYTGWAAGGTATDTYLQIEATA